MNFIVAKSLQILSKVPRKANTDSLLLFLVPRLRVFVQPSKSTNKQTDVSVQPTGK